VIWRISAVSIGTLAFGAVSMGTGAAATGCDDCAANPAADRGALCVAPGMVAVKVDGLRDGRITRTVRDLASGTEALVDQSSDAAEAVDCGVVQVTNDEASETPGEQGENPSENRTSAPTKKTTEDARKRRAALLALISGTNDAKSPGIPRGMHASIPEPTGSVPASALPEPRLPMVAATPRATTPAAGTTATGGDDGSVITIAIVAATAGAIGGGVLGAGWRRQRSKPA
jgi:hypothetical protein